MLGKRSRPAIGRLSGSLRPAGTSDTAMSPKSPLDCKTQSPRGMKNYDQGLVGLGIVVALDKSGSTTGGGGEILVKYAVSGQFNGRSDPIPVNPTKNFGKPCGCYEESSENYTYVTRRRPDKSVTRVYYDGGEHGRGRVDVDRGNSVDSDDGCGNGGGFKISPTMYGGYGDSGGCPSDFLSWCHLCRKTLHGKDIYMYRGEKAFCSAECRQRQIVMDERKERCRSEASRSSSVDVSSSPYTSSGRGQIFSTGIVAS
ncbi:hypothetical protein Ancab_027624 [Ancistrocladus abbreviatus]